MDWLEWFLRAWRRAHVAPWRLAGALVLAALAAWLALGLRRALAGLRLGRRTARARRGEVDAAVLLQEAGYRVVAVQPRLTLGLRVDGERQAYDVVADYLVVDRRGRLYVAEVKTGRQAPDPLYPPTRRQLLEYQLGYAGSTGVLLVDMEAGAVRRVRFADP